jgi:mediator of RNA polymerase II transcription subunit 14
VSISCTDQLSPTGGSFELRFSRSAPSLSLPHPNSLGPPPLPFARLHLRSNPHEEAEPFLRQVLRHGPLAPSLHRLVGLLRDTLPIAVEVDRMAVAAREDHRVPLGPLRQSAFIKGPTEEPWFDTFVKGMGWWRVLYGDLRYQIPSSRLLGTIKGISDDCTITFFLDMLSTFDY